MELTDVSCVIWTCWNPRLSCSTTLLRLHLEGTLRFSAHCISVSWARAIRSWRQPFWHERFGTSPEGKHSKQLYGSFLEVQAQYELYKRSIFAMCCVYNNLPQDVVDAASVSAFQSLLTQMARARCEQGAANWVFTFDLRQRT